MKKIFLLIFISFFINHLAFSQRFAYVDTDYILKKIPIYADAQTKLELLSAKWENELNEKFAELKSKMKKFQNEKILLSKEMRLKREKEINEIEKEANTLKNKYFGYEGELFKKRQEFIKPIQDEIYNAILEIAKEGSYAVIFDAANGATMLYTDVQYDKSDEVLKKLGY